ncbi:MAG: hypothetical protein ACRDN0_29855, partial [Trebonia sp.]
ALRQAHLYTRLGRVSMPEARFADAASSYDAAEALLGGEPGDQDDDAAVDHWLELMIDGRTSLYGVLGQADRAEAVLGQVGPLLRARGTPARKTEFYRLIAMAHLAHNGMRPADEDVELLRRSMAFSRQTGEAKDAAYAAHFLGFVLGLHGDLAEAREVHEEAVDMAERIGESVLLTGALTGLALIALHQRDSGTARSALARAVAAARGGEHDERGAGRAALWEKVAQVVLARLDQTRPDQPGDLAGLFGELTQFIGTTPGTLDMRLTDVLYLARGLGSPA